VIDLSPDVCLFSFSVYVRSHGVGLGVAKIEQFAFAACVKYLFPMGRLYIYFFAGMLNPDSSLLS
jgi:hypothetical protein